jgi:hypothetical protein
MAKRKKKRQGERVLEPLFRPGEPIKAPSEAPVKVPIRNYRDLLTSHLPSRVIDQSIEPDW